MCVRCSTKTKTLRKRTHLVFSAAYVPCYMRSLYMCTISRSDRSPCAHLCIVFAEPATPPPPPPHTLTTPFTKGLCCCCCCCARKHSGFLAHIHVLVRSADRFKIESIQTHARMHTQARNRSTSRQTGLARISIALSHARSYVRRISVRRSITITNYGEKAHQ